MGEAGGMGEELSQGKAEARAGLSQTKTRQTGMQQEQKINRGIPHPQETKYSIF